MRDDLSTSRKSLATLQATTARRMADAVIYLMRVADHAGMTGISKQLDTVRARLSEIQTQSWSQSRKRRGSSKRSE
jgi:hypothetical protein